jgi:hypothetical protein
MSPLKGCDAPNSAFLELMAALVSPMLATTDHKANSPGMAAHQ